MRPHQFVATDEELRLVERIHLATPRKYRGTFSRDAAIRLLRDSGLSHAQIRNIWTIADRRGSGKVCDQGLCVLIRLAGWVQQGGVAVTESLLEKGNPHSTSSRYII